MLWPSCKPNSVHQRWVVTLQTYEGCVLLAAYDTALVLKLPRILRNRKMMQVISSRLANQL